MSVFNQEQKDLLIGTLLGDGHLQTYTKGLTWRYQVKHTHKQRDYVFHKYGVLALFCKSPPLFASHFNKVLSKFYQNYTFRTVMLSELNFYGNLFYKYNELTGFFVKIVPPNIKDHLTPRAIAYWYMDDGMLRNGFNMAFCTNSFSMDDLLLLKHAFHVIYNFEAKLWFAAKKLNSNIDQYYLVFSAKQSRELGTLIKPFMLESFYYKLPK